MAAGVVYRSDRYKVMVFLEFGIGFVQEPDRGEMKPA
jgi:hypothetical protein